MTPVQLAEYKRRLAARDRKQRDIEEKIGWTAAPVRLWRPEIYGGEADHQSRAVASNHRTFNNGRSKP